MRKLGLAAVAAFDGIAVYGCPAWAVPACVGGDTGASYDQLLAQLKFIVERGGTFSNFVLQPNVSGSGTGDLDFLYVMGGGEFGLHIGLLDANNLARPLAVTLILRGLLRFG